MNKILLLLLFLPPQAPPTGRPEQAPAVELPLQAPQVILTYPEAYSEALRTGKRLAVFVGCPARDIEGVVTVSVPWEGVFKQFGRGTVVISMKTERFPGYLTYLEEVNAGASDARIQGKAVQPTADPFPRVQSTVDCPT